MCIAYFVHELADPAVRKRVQMFTTAERSVTLFGFERDRGAPVNGGTSAHVLGRTHNQRLLSRAISVLLAIPRALKLKSLWRDADVIVARNLEMLALTTIVTRLIKSRARIVYECLDIHRLLLSASPIGGMIRTVERACLRRTALIITSSPAFRQRYFRDQQLYGGEIILIENKVLSSATTAPPPAPAHGPPWIIAWCGMLRCRRSFELLRRAAQAGRGRLKVELWGAPALDQIPDFHDAAATTPHFSFHGRYAPAQLPAIYGGAHFAWAIDFYEAGGNSDWLLPNRLYESLAYGAAPIAIAGVETSRWLEARGVGVVLDPAVERSFPAFLDQLEAAAYAQVRAAILRLEPEATRHTPDSCRAFAARLSGAVA